MYFGFEKDEIQEDDMTSPSIEGREEDEQVTVKENLEEQMNEMKDRWMRAVAELENLRRRSQREKEDALKYGSIGFAREMLSVADNISRATQSKPVQDNISDSMKAYLDGIDMVAREFSSAFEKQNIKKINSLHQQFNPNLHQAMFETETAEHSPGTILQVVQEGYMMHDRLLRPALVGVAKVKKLDDTNI